MSLHGYKIEIPAASDCAQLAECENGDETASHMRRVGVLSPLLALSHGESWREASLLHVAAPLHDIGKIVIPDYILRKPGKLSDEEFNRMKEHTVAGCQILKSDPSTSSRVVAAQIALSHHERWDGTGYPEGLRGTMIPLAARITAIADVFDALTHQRPYKDAWTFDLAVETIKNESGRHFDPDLVAAFLDMLSARGLSALIDKMDRDIEFHS